MSVRRTRSQNRILQSLQGLQRAISAQDLYLELRNQGINLGLATVYRSLEALKLEGIVQARTLSSGESLYSLSHEDHHHLTCLRCGESVAIEECPVHALEAHLHQAHHFRIFYHTLEFFGLCARCQAEEAAT